MREWSYSFDGRNHYKIGEAELIEILAAGKLNGDTMVWTDGMSAWVKVSQSELSEHVLETAVCAASGRVMAKSEMLQYGEHWLDPDQKNSFVSSLMEDGKFQKKTGATAAEAHTGIGNTWVPLQRAKWSKILIIISSIYIFFLGFFEAYIAIFDPSNSALENLSMSTAVLRLLFNIPAIVLFCMWVYQIAVNCQSLKGAPLQTSPGWAVGWYFIPFAQLWMPYFSVKELWRVSLGAESRGSGSSTSIVSWWWAVWVFCGVAVEIFIFISEISAETSVANQDLWHLLLGIANALSSLITIIACFLIVKIITRITNAQRAVID